MRFSMVPNHAWGDDRQVAGHSEHLVHAAARAGIQPDPSLQLRRQGGRQEGHHPDEKDAKELIVSLPDLPAGTYKVVWHVLSVDTHKTQGDFKFTVQP